MPIETLDDITAMYGRKFDPAKAEGLDATVQLDISGEGGGQRILTIRDGEFTVAEGTHPDPTITVRSSIENFLKLNLGEANPMTLMMTGKVKVSGSVPLALKFTSLFFGS